MEGSKKMAKKFIWTVLVVLVIAVGITPTFAAGKKVEIQYAFWGNPTAIGVEKDIIEEFEKVNPDIKVNPIAVGYTDYHQKILTLIAGGQAPDVMRIDSYFFADFMASNAFKDIGKLIKRDKIDTKAYYQAGFSDCMYKGKCYGFPWSTAPLYMFLNLKMFKEAGIAVPPMNWTWTDFVKICTALSKGSGANHQYGFGCGFGNAGDFASLLPFIWANGGDLFDKSRTKFALNQPAATKQLQEIARLIKQGVFADPSELTSPEVINRWMVNNKLAMRIGAAAEILSLQQFDGFEFEIYPCPGSVKNRKTTVIKSNVVGISATSKNTDAAWKFLKFLRAPGQRGEVLYMMAKRMPPTVNDSKLWSLYSDPHKYPKNVVAVTKECSSKYAHLLPLRTGWLEVQGTLVPELQKVFTGQMTAQTAMKNVAPRINEILVRTKK
jgi:multiple sugar transport system substrate-binding protein